jgi:hypothetical protein
VQRFLLSWHVWEARNDVRNNEAQASMSRVASKVIAYVEMIIKYLYRLTVSARASVSAVRPRWIPSPEGMICINVDAALFPEDHRMGGGIVLRDHMGRFILSVSEGFNVFPAPELAEAMVARSGLVVAKEHHCSKVVLVSDCLSLIQRISSPRLDRSTLGSIISDIKFLAADFESCSFKFSSRSSNVVAHKLARSSEPQVCNISVSVIPGLIRDELCNDVF